MSRFPLTASGALDDEPPALADTTERLIAEFGARADARTIRRVVRCARRDLQGSPPGALPELVERLARQRLLSSSSSRPPLPVTPSIGAPPGVRNSKWSAPISQT